MTELGLALALILVIEGAAYALFPDSMKGLMARMQDQPSGALRWAGLAFAVVGVVLVWLIRRA